MSCGLVQARTHAPNGLIENTMQKLISVFIVVLLAATSLRANDDATNEAFASKIRPLINLYCIKCHGTVKSKGEIALHTLGDLSNGRDIEQWELVLDMLESSEMPPEEEPQPSPADRQAIITWIGTGLRNYVAKIVTNGGHTSKRASCGYNCLCEL